jgi:hypothetical protein
MATQLEPLMALHQGAKNSAVICLILWLSHRLICVAL